MPDYFVDSTTGSDGDAGTSMDAAWATLEHALEAGGLAAGDNVWVRRIHVEYSGAPTSDVECAYDGSAASPIRVIGWPRASQAITSSDWTNGSTGVVIDDGGMDREKHCGRFITGPDSRVYLITKVTDANNIIVDREYVGSTVTNQAATISADEDYALAQAIDDSAWTIKKAAWNADAADLPCLDFGNAAYQIIVNADLWHEFWNLEFRDSTDTAGIISCSSNYMLLLGGCLFKTDQNVPLVVPSSGGALDVIRCIFEGSASGTAQRGLAPDPRSTVRIRDSAIYGMGDNGLILPGPCLLERVNIGVEAANGDDDMVFGSISITKCIDVKLGGTNGTVDYTGATQLMIFGTESVWFENYGKILGAHKAWTVSAELTKTDVVDGSGDPYKRTGGADSVLAIENKFSATYSPLNKRVATTVAELRIWADTTSKSYRIYCQLKNVASLTADQILIECLYIKGYDDTTEYELFSVDSDETVTIRDDAADWSQYIEVTGIQPAVASWVILRVKAQWYDADGVLFVDPKVAIS